ncbi:High frequency lysogenization protein HflD [invertebrate metagenome]|uniref:High frequency lysogenization protein HflD n=1 Tax=invertebrate metagenome TaxID=1711999 RepID=A0A2H9T7V7_9ZZZZ
MAKYSNKERAAALSGVFQAAALVDQLAKTGQLPQDNLATSIKSLLVTSPENVAEVYGNAYSHLNRGSEVLAALLNKQNTRIHNEVIRYTMALIHIERKLSCHADMLATIGQRLERVKEQVNIFGLLHDNVFSSIASIYLDTVSTFKARIQVKGDVNVLKMKGNPDKVRALLLAGIRSAMLWHQVGGRRWELFFQRKKLLDGLRQLAPAH